MHRIQLESGYFIDTLLHYLRATGIPARQLSRFIGIERLKSIIQALHDRGILTIIEDFGSGSDSIGFLRSVPVDAVSINQQSAIPGYRNRSPRAQYAGLPDPDGC